VKESKERWSQSNRIKIGVAKSTLLLSSKRERHLWSIINDTVWAGKVVYCLYDSKNHNNFNNTLIEKGAVGIYDISEIKY
jgi:hypothetical protein